jgi:hypothetical protein
MSVDCLETYIKDVLIGFLEVMRLQRWPFVINKVEWKRRLGLTPPLKNFPFRCAASEKNAMSNTPSSKGRDII